MPTADLVLALDQGTTSTRAILFDREGRPLASDQRELPQIFPAEGWVEHDPEEIWQATVAVMRGVVAKSGIGAERIAAIGITNQRETTVLWQRADGKPIHNAIVWQDRRGAPLCRKLIAEGHGPAVQAKTGLLIDSYFSATKIAWILENVAGARAAAEAGQLAFGTIDSFLLWRLTGGKVHATDATNASRSLVFDIGRQDWDADLLKLFGIPAALLPTVEDSAGLFGHSAPDLLGRPIPIAGIAGDQQAALVGQACLSPGMIKSTYGTGCFALLHTGDRPVPSRNKLVATVAYRLGGKPSYAMEGSIFVAGAAMQWLRDKLKVIAQSADSAALAQSVADTGGVYLVPGFVGLGAPYWDADARGAILGLTRDSDIAHIVRAALESVCYQTRDLLDAMAQDGAAKPQALRVDGGMAANDWCMQFLADMLAVPVERPVVTETTALGAAYLAGLGVGLFASPNEIGQRWRRDRLFEPKMSDDRRQTLYRGWLAAVKRTLS